MQTAPVHWTTPVATRALRGSQTSTLFCKLSNPKVRAALERKRQLPANCDTACTALALEPHGSTYKLPRCNCTPQFKYVAISTCSGGWRLYAWPEKVSAGIARRGGSGAVLSQTVGHVGTASAPARGAFLPERHLRIEYLK
jgi:hypothetical protein